MRHIFIRLCVRISNVIHEEHGQDLVEYAAVITLVVLALVGGMNTLANGINTAMVSVVAQINSVIG